MRNAYLAELYDLAQNDERIYALVADNGAIVYDNFRRDFPGRFINFGISEANMVSMAAGLASGGNIPFAYTITAFLTMRAFEQIRNDVCLQKQNVKLVGVGAGFVYSTLGPTHHCTEDIALMRLLPNMTVFSPASPLEAKNVTKAAAACEGPVYIRLGTSKEPEIYAGEYNFKPGRGVTIKDGSDLTLIATGSIVYDVLQAAGQLNEKGIQARVINIHTIKPLDTEILLQAAEETGAILTVEEHLLACGLGSAVAEVLVGNCGSPLAFDRMGVNDCFCQGYGPHMYLKQLQGLTTKNITERALTLVHKKSSLRK